MASCPIRTRFERDSCPNAPGPGPGTFWLLAGARGLSHLDQPLCPRPHHVDDGRISQDLFQHLPDGLNFRQFPAPRLRLPALLLVVERPLLVAMVIDEPAPILERWLH